MRALFCILERWAVFYSQKDEVSSIPRRRMRYIQFSSIFGTWRLKGPGQGMTGLCKYKLTLNILHCTLYTLYGVYTHSTLYTVQTVRCVHTIYTIHCTHCTVCTHTLHCTLYTVHSSHCTVCTVYIVYSKLSSQCLTHITTVCRVHRTVWVV